MSDLNSTITRLRMVRAPSLSHDDFFIPLWSLELKRQSGRQPCAPLQLCVSLQIRRPPAPSITHTSFPSPPSPLPSQAILIKSVSLAWQGKIIGEGFWMPFTLNGARFFPFSCFFSSTPTAFAITPRPSSPGMQLPIFLFFPPPPPLLPSHIQMWNMD